MARHARGRARGDDARAVDGRGRVEDGAADQSAFDDAAQRGAALEKSLVARVDAFGSTRRASRATGDALRAAGCLPRSTARVDRGAQPHRSVPAASTGREPEAGPRRAPRRSRLRRARRRGTRRDANLDDRNPHRDRDGDDSYDDVYDSDDTSSCATSSSSTASEAPPPVARPSAEWLRAIHAELPLATIRRVRRHLAPTVPLGLGSGSGGTKDPALERVESLSASGEVSRVVGPAPPTTVRRFAGDAPEVRRWLRGYAMGLVLLRQQSGGMGFAPLFDAPRVRLFRVVEVRRGG